MTAIARTPSGFPVWALTHARPLLAGVHLIFAIPAPLYMFTRHHLSPAGNAVAVIAALLAITIELLIWDSVSRSRRPRAWTALAVALCAVVYLPMISFGLDWVPLQWFVIAAALMLLPTGVRAVVACAPVIGSSIGAAMSDAAGHYSGFKTTIDAVYFAIIVVMGGLALYGSARLVSVLEELYDARLELADFAVGRERLRISRDLHDLLGHSLSAISLKGDLAIALVDRDPVAARAEIDGIGGVARTALRDMRAVARDEHAVSLYTELDTVVAVLRAAGVSTQVHVDLADLSADADAVLAWTVRESATNVLRHADATTCTFRSARRDDMVQLAVVNDGADATVGEGHGLTGLSDRAEALGGTVSWSRADDRTFRLVVTLPEEHS